MATLAGSITTTLVGFNSPNSQTFNLTIPSPSYGLMSSMGFGASTSSPSFSIQPQNILNGIEPRTPSYYWFERIHRTPDFFHLGSILTTLNPDIEIYNSYRYNGKELNTATNNAGTGLSFQNLPELPYFIYPNSGLIFQLLVSTQGQPSIDGTLNFETTAGDLSIDVTGIRVVLLASMPEGNIVETLEFLTDTMRSVDGSEQRVRVRNHPRQIFDYQYQLNDNEERQKLEAFLYKWHPQIFGIPVWTEVKRLTAPITAGDTTIYLDTRYADFRENGLIIVWTDYETYDSLQVSSITDSSITVSSPVSRNYPAYTRVMPLRSAVTKQEIAGDKYPVDLYTFAIKFHVVDNETDIASTAAFSSHNGKVMFNDYNWVPRGQVTDTYKSVLHHIDNRVGDPIQFSSWVNATGITSKGFFCKNPQKLWELRQVLHALGGSYKSFYLPTFYNDLTVKATIVSGSYTMDINHIRYTDFINGKEPNKSLYLVLTNGTIITRQVMSAVEIDSTTERLTVDVAWGSNILTTDIARVSFLKLCRFESDTFEINHNNSGQATMASTVWGVIQ